MFEQERLKEAINRTGFPTEYLVQKVLETHGWDVVSNRYYIDDQKKIEREIDLLASKGSIKLVISCKKNDEEYWTFMVSKNDSVSVPLEYKTDDPVIDYFWKYEKETIKRVASTHSALTSLLSMSDMVRAFQQVKKSNYTPGNDKNIYESIITTIKAAEYEGSHSKSNVAYFMLSIFNGEMIKMDFDDGSCVEIEEIKYVNRHYIGSKDKYYCVHFIRFDALDRVIADYDQVAEEIPKLLGELHEEFKKDVFSYRSRIDYFWEILESKFFNGLNDEYGHGTHDFFSDLSTNPTSIRWYFSKSRKLHLAFNLYLFTHRRSGGEELNKDEFCRNLMAELLKEYYGYEGPFVMENDPDSEARDRRRYFHEEER